MSATPQIERHPLKPFLPANAQLLMLGSFPPPKERWCMDFFYPNPQNDMWRIMGHIFYGDKAHFEAPSTKVEKRVFNRDEIVSFCRAKGIAIFDTAQAVIRLQGHDICCTGGKAAQTLAETLHCVLPKVGEYIETSFAGRTIRFWRMPSSSRAYPLSLDKKAAAYRQMFETIGLLENLYSYIYLAFWTYRHRK